MLATLERREAAAVPEVVEALELLGTAAQYLDLPLHTVSERAIHPSVV
jgi:hypothetical protein